MLALATARKPAPLLAWRGAVGRTGVGAHKLSWKGVAAGAIGAAAGAGMGKYLTSGMTAAQIDKGLTWSQSVVRATGASVAAQGMSSLLGVGSFSWKAVAASAAGAGASAGLRDTAWMTSLNRTTTVAAGTVNGLINGGIQAGIFETNPNWGSIAAQSFGNALGDSLAAEPSRGSQQEDVLGQFIDEQLLAQDRRDFYSLASAPNAPYVRLGGSPGKAVQEWSDDVDMMILNSGSNRERRDAYLAASSADASDVVKREVQRLEGTVRGAAKWVYNGLSFANDQGWTAANFVSGGLLADNNDAARAAVERNAALGRGLVSLPEKVSVTALRALTGSLTWDEVGQGVGRALRTEEIAALEARGDYAGAQMIRTENALNIASFAVGAAPAARSAFRFAGSAGETALLRIPATDDFASASWDAASLGPAGGRAAQLGAVHLGNVEGRAVSALWSETPGVLSGRRTAIPSAADAETVRSLMRENESADILVRNGFNVEQNPSISGSKNPDYRINGEVFDNYAPATGRALNIWKNVQGKVEAGQAPNVVINLADSPATIGDLVGQFTKYKIPDLQRVIFVDQKGNVSVHLHYKTGN